MSDLTAHIRDFDQAHPGILSSGSLLVAVSGGPDSISLAHALHGMGFSIGIAHVNYNLRPESVFEEELVRAFALELQVPFHFHSLPKSATKVDGASTQALAREARYAFFKTLLAERDYTCCATAHQQDDQAETLLLSLLRGGHAGYLSGIPAHRTPFVRPLLKATREDVMAYVRGHRLAFATDSSNLEPAYLRNRIRLEALPALRSINPSADERLIDHWQALEERESLLDHLLMDTMGDAVETEWEEGGVHLDLELVKLPDRFKKQIITRFLKEQGFFGNEIKEALKLESSLPGAAQEFRGRKILRTKNGFLIPSMEKERYENNPPLEIAFPEPLPRFHMASTSDRKVVLQRMTGMPERLRAPEGTHWLDMAALKPPIRIRTWQQGDRMQPLGMKGSKLLSDVFSEMGTNVLARQRALVFADAEGPFLVEGFRIADRVKIRPATAEVLIIEIEKIVNDPPNNDVQEPS